MPEPRIREDAAPRLTPWQRERFEPAIDDAPRGGAGSVVLVIFISIVLWALIAAAGGALFMWLFA